MTILFVRTIILYTLVVIALRLMGKRQIGELQPSELVVAIMISDLACVPMSEVSVPLLYGIVPIFTLVISEILLSFVSLKSERVRTLLSGRPQILMKNGTLCFREMKRARVNIDDLLEELRKTGCYSLSDADTVILETGGNITVIPSKEEMPLTAGDMNIKKEQVKIPFVYIADGRVRVSEVKRGKKTMEWVKGELKKNKIEDVKSVFLMIEESGGNVYIQKRKDKK